MHHPRLAGGVKILHYAFIFSLPSMYWMQGHPTFLAGYTVVLWLAVLGNVLWCGCPLTILEKTLRGEASGDEKRPGSFVVRRVEAWFGIKLPRWCVTLTLVAFTFGACFLLYHT